LGGALCANDGETPNPKKNNQQKQPRLSSGVR